MKNKLNALSMIIVTCLVGSAYAACYLNQVEVCKSPGANAGARVIDCGYPLGTQNITLYASEYAYWKKPYEVGSGGKDLMNISDACDSDSGNPSGNGFLVYYYSPCVGTWVYGENSYWDHSQQYPNTIANPSDPCN
jgi:hypothetical protein